MKKIELTQGYFTKVDAEDFDRLNKYSWHVVIRPYTNYAVANIKGKVVQMHRLIVKCPLNKIVDHKNRNGLDNRKENLRICTRSQNRMNCIKNRGNKTGYKGVHKSHMKSKPYRSQIRYHGKIYHLGCFRTAKAAARAYDVKSFELFGEFARGNYGTV